MFYVIPLLWLLGEPISPTCLREAFYASSSINQKRQSRYHWQSPAKGGQFCLLRNTCSDSNFNRIYDYNYRMQGLSYQCLFVQKLLIKRWWNRPQGSFSSTFYMQLSGAQITKAQKRLTTWLPFCAFWICTHKIYF